jgi:hypothetical protein
MLYDPEAQTRKKGEADASIDSDAEPAPAGVTADAERPVEAPQP